MVFQFHEKGSSRHIGKLLNQDVNEPKLTAGEAPPHSYTKLCLSQVQILLPSLAAIDSLQDTALHQTTVNHQRHFDRGIRLVCRNAMEAFLADNEAIGDRGGNAGDDFR